jgi:drug/metabolite transporter (DMT)-like permease
MRFDPLISLLLSIFDFAFSRGNYEMNRNRTTGHLFALGAALALSGSFIFSKSALNQLSMIQFGLVWFSLGVVWNSAWFLVNKEYRKLSGSFRNKFLVAAGIAILEGAATGLFYMAIKEMENPAVVSFLGNIGPVFVTLMGITLLKERFLKSQLTGIIITIAGIFIINYREGGFAGFLDPGAMYVISASLLFALATILGRWKQRYLEPGFMSLIRSVLLAVLMGVLVLKSGRIPELNPALWRDLALGSMLETLIVIVFAYQSLKLIEATKTSLIISSKGVWTLILAWIFLDVFPSGVQLAGGVMTFIGVWLITWDRRAISRE